MTAHSTPGSSLALCPSTLSTPGLFYTQQQLAAAYRLAQVSCHISGPRLSQPRFSAATDPAHAVAPVGTPSTASPAPRAMGPTTVPGQAGQFTKGALRRTDLDPHGPIAQFHSWFTDASQPGAGVAHPETCTLATASLPSGRVSARMVYMKELDPRGFVIYSNFGTSGKARDLLGRGVDGAQPNPWASLVFFWEGLERQVRVEGRAERLPAEESQAYFDTRVRGSRIGAWASRQSSVLKPNPEVEGDDGRAQLEGWVKDVEEKFQDSEEIPVPEFWGGLRIVPEKVEFWQGRQNRLHDRFVYERVLGEDGTDKWTLERLSP